MPIEIEGWSASIRNLLAWKKVLACESRQNLARNNPFNTRQDAKNWIANQKNPEFWIDLPRPSLHTTAHINSARRMDPRKMDWPRRLPFRGEDIEISDSIDDVIKDADTICFSTCVLDDREFYLLSREVEVGPRGRLTDRPEVTLSHTDEGFRRAIYHLFGAHVPAELVILLGGLHQINLQLEDEAEYFITPWRSENECRQAARLIQQLRHEEMERLTLILPPGPVMVERENQSAEPPPTVEQETPETSLPLEASPEEVSATSAFPRPDESLTAKPINTSEAREQRAKRRQAVVMPILESKGWTRGKLVTKTGAANDAVYKYLDGTIEFLSDKNRKAFAAALGLKEEELPR